MTERAPAPAEREVLDDKLAATVAEIVELCDGDAVAAVGTVYVAYCLLEEEYKRLARQTASGLPPQQCLAF